MYHNYHKLSARNNEGAVILAMSMTCLGIVLFILLEVFPNPIVYIVNIIVYNLIGVVVSTVITSRILRNKLLSVNDLLNAKKAFVRYIGHEIRGPLNVAVIGMSLLQAALFPTSNGVTSFSWNEVVAEIKEIFVDVQESIGISVDTLNQFLLFEKIDSNMLELETTMENPISFLLSCLQMYQLAAKKKKIVLTLPHDELSDTEDWHNQRILVDTSKMSQVIRNLMSNAMKFTGDGGWISVIATKLSLPNDVDNTINDVWLEVRVRDSGVGLAPENVKKMFTEGLQFDANKNQGGNGSGLGLFISKRIVEQHGGQLSVESEGIGKGVTMILKILLVNTSNNNENQSSNSTINQRNLSRDGNDNSLDTVEDLNDDFDNSRLAELPKKHTTPVADNVDLELGPNKSDIESASTISSQTAYRSRIAHLVETVKTKVLIVDDSDLNRKMVSRLLEKSFKMDINVACDGLEAVNKIQALLASSVDPPEMIFMDHMMPIMDGPEATKHIRQLGYKGLIYGLTGQALVEDKDEFQHAGADHIFVKPLDIVTFVAYMKLNHPHMHYNGSV